MSVVTRATAKTYFETGDIPTQAQFANTLDSVLFPAQDRIYTLFSYTNSYNEVNTINAVTGLFANPVFQSVDSFNLQYYCKVNTAFSGGSINSATIQIAAVQGANELLANTFNVFLAANNRFWQPIIFADAANAFDFAAAYALRVRITIGSILGTQRLTNLAAGSVTIGYRYLPVL